VNLGLIFGILGEGQQEQPSGAAMIHVVATIEVYPGKRAEFLSIFTENVANVLSEDGCLAYNPAVDVDAALEGQPPLRENVVVVVERWASLENLHAHLKAPHMTAYREQVKDLVKRVELRVLTSA
jgi:quinol monooxygenase YgiN